MLQPLSEGWVYRWEPIVARAWGDEEFKKRLLEEPSAVLKEHGVETTPGVKIKVVENGETLVHLTIPTKPDKHYSREVLDEMVSDKFMEHELWGAEIVHLTVEAAYDVALKNRLLSDPISVLKTAGFEVPADLQIKVVENTDHEYCITLPAKPQHMEPAELSDEDLARVVGGSRIGGSIWFGANQRLKYTTNPAVRAIRGAGVSRYGISRYRR
jgi:hypothetical protein